MNKVITKTKAHSTATRKRWGQQIMGRLRTPYLLTITLVGMIIVGWAAWQLPQQSNFLLFGGLIGFALVLQIGATVSQHIRITFTVNQAITVTTLATLGLPCAVVIGALSGIMLWACKTYQKQKNWMGSWHQLAFNIGMFGIIDFIAGSLFIALSNLLTPNTLLYIIIPYMVIAIVIDQLNFWLLMGLLALENKVNPLLCWWEQRATILLNIAITITGSLVLTTAINALGIVGLVVICVPLGFVAYAFQIYAKQADLSLSLLKERTQELEKTNQELGNLLQAKDQFLAVLSHDMRTSLGAIRMSTEMLDDPAMPLTEEKETQLLQLVSLNERTLTGMVNNILEVEQIRSDGVRELTLTRVNLSQTIEQVAASLVALAEYKKIRLHCYTRHEPVFVEGDEHMIYQVVLNLISNALKYTPDQGCVFISLNSDGRQIILDVEDTGYGIPEANLDAIFEPYHRVKEHQGKALGTGLGLSIVKQFVESHNGTIEVDSRVNVGSRFTVQLPIIAML